MTEDKINNMCPFFIVTSVPQTIAFYETRLGFKTLHHQPEDAPFFAILGREGATLFIKSGNAAPQPNPTRDPDMRWDAFLSVADPDTLAAEFLSRNTPFSRPLQNTRDGLRGFEITDPDGYVLFFGSPSTSAVR